MYEWDWAARVVAGCESVMSVWCGLFMSFSVQSECVPVLLCRSSGGPVSAFLLRLKITQLNIV